MSSWQWQEIAAKKDGKGKPAPAGGVLTIHFRNPQRQDQKPAREERLRSDRDRCMGQSDAARA